MRNASSLQNARLNYQPKLAGDLSEGIKNVKVNCGQSTEAVKNKEEIQKLFKDVYGQPVVSFSHSGDALDLSQKNIGVILSGGQAPGGHNVIAGLYDAMKQANPLSKLYGFLGGPSGVIDDKQIVIEDELINDYRNTGGFDIIGSGRTKIETEEQFEKTLATCKKHNISAIVIIGGDDSNTNACMLAQWFKNKNADIQVIGCPKTIDGDLKNSEIETSFGFDTAAKTYSELVGNIERDAISAKKYWHFIKLMGRSATHVGLEVALQTRPNIALISEEVIAKEQSLKSIVDYIADIVVQRANLGKNFGVVLVPEGLIEFIPEMKNMIAKLNDVLADSEKDENYRELSPKEKGDVIFNKLDSKNASLFNSLPSLIKAQLLLDRDPHGNVQVSKIETEKLLIEMVKRNLKNRSDYNGKFSEQAHFFGYEGRCAMPSNFDSDYCYSLGYNAYALIAAGLTGYLSCIKNLTSSASEWKAGGVPLTTMMNMEKRNGQMKPVIQKALVELDGAVFNEFEKNRKKCELEDCYVYPGAIQYFGPKEVCDNTTFTLQLEQKRAAAKC